MSKQKLQRIATAFVLNNDPEEVNESLHQMYKLAEKSKDDLTPRQWSKCKLYMAEIDFFVECLCNCQSKGGQ